MKMPLYIFFNSQHCLSSARNDRKFRSFLNLISLRFIYWSHFHDKKKWGFCVNTSWFYRGKKQSYHEVEMLQQTSEQVEIQSNTSTSSNEICIPSSMKTCFLLVSVSRSHQHNSIVLTCERASGNHYSKAPLGGNHLSWFCNNAKLL